MTSRETSIEIPLEELRQQRSAKWTAYPPDVIPAWIAQMDFRTAEPIKTALQEIVSQEDFGYPRREGQQPAVVLAQAFSEWMDKRFGWSADPALAVPVSDLAQAKFAAILAFSDPGDGIALQTPCYPPMLEAIRETGRRFIDNPLVDAGEGVTLDIDGLARAIDPGTRMILLCNPHNPTGRVFEEQELEALVALARRHDLVIVSDEIHQDLVYPGRRHMPLAALSAEAAKRTVTITSPAKSFNIPGLRCGVMHFGSQELKDRFHRRIPRRLLGQPGIAGMDAAITAWREGEPWLSQVLARLTEARAQFEAAVGTALPAVRWHAPEATYFAWLDCRDARLPTSAGDFFLKEARVAFSPGESFSPGYRDFVRVNFATSTAILQEIIARMGQALLRFAR